MDAAEPAAENMAPPALPTDATTDISQDPGLAGTLLIAETLLGSHLSFQALKT